MPDCAVCGFSAKSKAGLSTHVKRKHSDPQAPASVVAAVRATVGSSTDPLAVAALRLAEMLDDPMVSARDAAGLARELRQTLAQVDDVEEKADALDELAQRRRVRGADASDPRRSAGGDVRGS